ncbi:unnamed protein product [Sphagnum jensenii]|uniref:Uncharacterized protein n=1 Tax=Sphagnum jensenii TaxID=128206 RepID=A0ABP1A963_9BRYO
MASHDEHRHQLPIVPRRKLGGAEGLEVSALGLGCMGMTGVYGASNPEEEMIELINMLCTMALLSLILLISMVVMPTKFSSGR